MSRSSSSRDNAASDSGVIDEVVRAMSSELGRVRAEKEQLRSDKEQLQRELDDAHLELRALREREGEKRIRDGGSLYEEARREIDKLVKERDEERSKNENAMQQVLDECTKLKDKYKKKKALLSEANSELEQLRASAASSAACTSLERRERNSRKRKATNEDEQPIDTVTVQQVHLNYQEAPRTEQGDAHVDIGDEPAAIAAKDPREIVKRGLDVSNIREFLGVSSSDILKEPSLEHCQRLIGKDKWTKLHTRLWTARIDRQMKYCADDSIIWCPRSSMRCIFVHPVHCYSPETQCYRTFDYRDFMRQGETKDLCLSKGITSLYCGTYRCIAVSDMHMAELFQLLLTNQIDLTTYLVNRVMVLGPFTSPASGASKSQVLLDAFMDGKILVRCHRLEYVGRDSAVSAFYAQCASDKSIHGQPEYPSDDGCKSRKRLRKGQ